MSSKQCSTGGNGSDCQSRGSELQHPPGSALIDVRVVGSPPNVSLHPPPKEGPPAPTTCWICGETDVRDAVFCPHCDSGANHAHVTCIVDRARAKNEEDYCNIICEKDSIVQEDKQSLQKSYKSIKSKIQGPWLKCGRCGEKHREAAETLLADKFFNCYKDKDSTDIRLCFAFFATIMSEFNVLDQTKSSSGGPYYKVQRFKEIMELQCNQGMDTDCLFTRFRIQVEEELTCLFATAEFFLPAKVSPKPTGACCWICLDGGPDEHGEEVVRACACRGEGGYCHASCIGQYAAEKNRTTMQNMLAGPPLTHDEFKKQLALPWTQCPTCNQNYTGDVAVALVINLVLMYEQFPYNEQTRMMSIETLADVCIEQSAYDTAINCLCKEMHLIKKIRGDIKSGGGKVPDYWLAPSGTDPDLVLKDMRQKLCEDEMKYCGRLLGCYKAKKDHKNANDLLKYLKGRGVEALAYSGGEISIDDLLKGKSIKLDNEARLKKLIKESGADSPEVLSLKFTLARELIGNGEMEKGYFKMFEVVGEAKRILGPEHPKTVEYTKWANLTVKGLLGGDMKISDPISKPPTKAKLISDTLALNDKKVNAVRYTKDGQKLIVDFLEPEAGKPKRFKVTPDQLVFGIGTVVVMPDGRFGMISEFDMDTKKYGVIPHGEMSVKRYTQIALTVEFQPFDVQKGTLA